MFGAMKRLWNVRTVNVRAKRELYESLVLKTVMYGLEAWGLRVEVESKLDVMEMRCLRSMCGVTRMDRLRYEVVRERACGMYEC